MNNMTEAEVAGRFRTTIELSEVMLQVREARLRRAHPEATDEELRDLLRQELAARPLDGSGVPEPDAGTKFRTAIALADAGVAMKRAQLERDDPAASKAEILARLNIWLSIRPGAESGDGAGRPRPIDR
jgi:hypothetical protein